MTSDREREVMDAMAYFRARNAGIEVDAPPPPRSPLPWVVAALVLAAGVAVWMGGR